MSSSRTVLLSDLFDVNPKRSLAKGHESKFVAMADLAEHQRSISSWTKRPFKSGSRFQNGDVLVARITPCLENGKTAFVDILDEGAVGHGSTEFIVLAARDGVADPLFGHYLATSPRFRDYATSRMIGSSGRQRVSAGEVGEYRLEYAPTLDEQRAIAEVLGSLDDRIEWSKRVLQALETLLTTTFGLLDRRQEATALGSVMELTSGRSYKSIDLVDQSTVGLINLKNIPRGGGYRSEGVKGYSGAYKPSQVANPGDLVLACTDLTQAGDVIGRVGRVRSHRDFETLVPSMDLALVRPSVDWVSSHVLAAVMSESEYIRHVKRYVNGTTVLHLDKRGVLDYEVRLPTAAALRDFAQFAGDVWERQDLLVSEADSLIGLRDALLPKLVSGELRIDNPERLLDQVA